MNSKAMPRNISQTFASLFIMSVYRQWQPSHLSCRHNLCSWCSDVKITRDVPLVLKLIKWSYCVRVTSSYCVPPLYRAMIAHHMFIQTVFRAFHSTFHCPGNGSALGKEQGYAVFPTDRLIVFSVLHWTGSRRFMRRDHGTILRYGLKYEGWNLNSGNYLFTTDTK